jgi:hypothetical protein
MLEKRKTRTQAGRPSGSWDTADPGTVTVSHGPYAEQLPVADRTVGEIRRRFADRFDIDPESVPFVDGNAVDDDFTVRAGQLLSFARQAGEKGAESAVEAEAVMVRGHTAEAVSPEGRRASLPVADLLEAARPPRRPDSDGLVLPDGVKVLVPTRRGAIVVHQTPPRVHNFRWITKESGRVYGRAAKYRPVRIALPYVVVVATFTSFRGGKLLLSGWNECFFRNEPLRNLDDALCFPALLNCSRLEADPAKPLAWICTQLLDRTPLARPDDADGPMQGGLRALLAHLFETGFNYSSEHHELSSWFSETVAAGIDPRLASVEAWEAATNDDPLFALDVAWLPAGHTLRQVTERIRRTMGGEHVVASAADLARLIFNHAGAASRAAREGGLS